MAINQVTIEDQAVGIGSNITVQILVENDVLLTALTLPLEIRTVSGGAYMADNTLLLTLAGRVGGSDLEDFATLTYHAVPTIVGGGCSGPVSSEWGASVTSMSNDGSPDAVFWGGVAANGPGMPAGVDAAGVGSILLSMGTNNSPGDFIIDTMCKFPANHILMVDAGSNGIVPAFRAGTITLLPNLCPINVAAASDPVNATVGSPAGNAISATDPEGDAVEYFLNAGLGAVDQASGAWSYTPTCADLAGFDVTVEATDKGEGNCVNSSLVTFHVNVSPTALNVACSDDLLHVGGLSQQAVGASGGCPPYGYAASIGTIDGQGNWEYLTGCADIGTQAVTVTVSDAAGQQTDCVFSLEVTNAAPVCNPDVVAVLFPQNVNTAIDVSGSDADGDAITYQLISGTGWGDEDLSAGGIYSGTRPGGDGAAYTVTYEISDGCATVTCTFDVIFENPCIEIVDLDSGDPYSWVFNGRNHTVGIKAAGGSVPGGLAGGFDFLICYDASGLSFLGASQPGADDGPGWEYFTYRTGMFGGNCSGGCADGYVRLFSIADMNDGIALDPIRFNIDGDILAELTFFVTSDRNFVNSCFHIGFCAYDCGDNTISDPSGDIIFVGRDDGGLTYGPDYWESCLEGKPGSEYLREISFCGGAICIMEPPDDRGDLNLNGIANEIGDAVLYTNFFIYGSSVWNADALLREVQIFSSDINDDGIVLTIADLIYLIRIITGDEAPFPPGTGTGSPKLSPYANSVGVVSDVSNGALTTRTMSNVELGGAVFVYRYSGVQIGTPEVVGGSNLNIQSAASNGELRVIIHPDFENGGSLAAGTHNLVRIPVSGNGSIELVESQFSDANGALLTVSSAAAVLPTNFALSQNYPNPFNAGTVIKIALPEQSQYSLTIYNVAGQVVRNFSGNGIGNVDVAWDGTSSNGSTVASGMYFYRMTAGEFQATKKMVLLK